MSDIRDDLRVIGVPGETGRCASLAKRLRFFSGIALMAVSFLVYPAYSVIVFLPFSGEMKLGAIASASLLSWGVFCTGTFLAGREGYEWFKGMWRRCGW